MLVNLHLRSKVSLCFPCRIALKTLKVSNRAILISCISATLAGSLLSSDWQAFGYDPCQSQHYTISRSGSVTHTTPQEGVPNTYINETSNGILPISFDEHSVIPSINVSLLFANQCIAMSTLDHTCYWNPLSRVTGKLCIECHPACRSEQSSLNFIQFCAGFGIILFVSQLFLTSVYSIASDYTPRSYQVSVQSNGSTDPSLLCMMWAHYSTTCTHVHVCIHITVGFTTVLQCHVYIFMYVSTCCWQG